MKKIIMILVTAVLATLGCQTTYHNQENFLVNNQRDQIEKISYLFSTGEDVVLETKMEDGSFQKTTYHKYRLDVVTRTGKEVSGFAVSLEDFSRENVFDKKTRPESLTFFGITIQRDGGEKEEIIEIAKTR